MSENNKKQFGVWMDSHNAVIVGRENIDSGNFVILGREKSIVKDSNSNENTSNNAEKGSLQKFFKSITSHMQNVEEVHVTGTGITQEQFIKYMAQSPQFKNAVAKESTSNKMSEENLIDYVTAQFN